MIIIIAICIAWFTVGLFVLALADYVEDHNSRRDARNKSEKNAERERHEKLDEIRDRLEQYL